MTVIRAALYVGVASVVVVWLSSAATSMAQREGEIAVVDTVQEPGGLAVEVQEQGRRLRQRLAAGPPPPRPQRNPFEFRAASAPGRPAGASRPPESATFEPSVPAISDPRLSLIGVATRQMPGGAVRTAMIATAGGELIMAVAGDSVLDRFLVTVVDAGSVELLEPATGATTRLVLGLEAHQER